MSLFLAQVFETQPCHKDLKQALFGALDRIEAGRVNTVAGAPHQRVLVIPPDFTRYHSRAGELTRAVWEYYGERLRCVLPALGTHRPMTEPEIAAMFGDVPRELFAVHHWRSGLAHLGEIPADFIEQQSEGQLHFAIPVQVNRLMVEGGFDLILSIGQVVPHEVAGMAGHSKNILIGAGGPGMIHKSHYLGAVYGMERIMGRSDNPVRAILNLAADRFLPGLPIAHALTVVGAEVLGLFIGDDRQCFDEAARLSLRLNLTLLDRPIRKAVVYLSPEEFHSTWLGNKAIYRTRMVMADGGELLILAPGVGRFGEDAAIDALIRKIGYTGAGAVREAVDRNPDLRANLSAAAHLIHGSSDGRFAITYAPGHLSQEEIEAVGFRYNPLERSLDRYHPAKMNQGYNELPDGEEVFFISNPALGLWAHRDRFPPLAKEADACLQAQNR
jgi:nickel-dependent lactate racemase